MGKIINCHYDGAQGGLGDFLRGSIHLYERCKNHNIDFDIDFSKHKLSKYLVCDNKYDFSEREIVDISKKLNNYLNYQNEYDWALFSILDNLGDSEVSYINSSFDYFLKRKPNFYIKSINDYPPLSEDCINFFKNKLVFSDLVESSVANCLEKFGLSPQNFSVIHFRMGDKCLISDEKNPVKYKQCFDDCLHMHSDLKKPLVVISDSNNLKKYIKKRAIKLGLPFYIFHENSNHTQTKPSSFDGNIEVTDDCVFYSLFDLKLLSMAESAISYSVYNHGSGFFSWICKIYEISSWCFLNSKRKVVF